MKLRYILGSFLSAILFVGCADESSHMGTYGYQLEDETFVVIPADGGDAVVKLNLMQTGSLMIYSLWRLP